MSVPAKPKIYHIVHVDRLPSIINDGYLWCDAKVTKRSHPGTTIGMEDIKKRRLENKLYSRPGLYVGDCVPFYFCPRSIMLYVIDMAHGRSDHELAYHGGQEPIVHLEADLRQTVAWAKRHRQRWAFTSSNAGAFYFEDWCKLKQLQEINWDAVQAPDWRGYKWGKQAEFLIEKKFPWELVSRIGVCSKRIYRKTVMALRGVAFKPHVEIKRDWYY